MITLTLAVADPDAIIAAGYPNIQVQKSSDQTSGGVYTGMTPLLVLQSGVTSYTFVDVNGSYADWYRTVFYNPAGPSASTPSQSQAGWLTDLCAGVRTLLGVDTSTVSDGQIQGIAYLPAALAQVRQRVSTFDTILAAGGDLAAMALSALAHKVAVLLCPAMTVQVVDMEQFKDYRYQRNRALDWNATAQTLSDAYEFLISQVAQESIDDLAVYDVPGVIMAGPDCESNSHRGGLRPFTVSGIGNF